jgi:peptidoglycan/xylan/chitin deacetylase (PgdA/CDA1 family)
MTGLSQGFAAGVRNEGIESRSRWSWPDDDRTAARSRLKSAKLWVLKRAERAGLFRRVQESHWRASRVLILAYHGISLTDEHKWNPSLYMPPSALRARFELIRDGGYQVLPLREGIARLQSGTLPPRAVALTFDDGMHDFHAAAVPILQEFRYPATVYVTTYYAEKQVPVFMVACRYLLWTGRGRTISGDGLTIDGKTLHLPEANQHAAVLAIESRLAKVAGGVAEELATLQRLAARVGADFDGFIRDRVLQIMTPDEIRSLPPEIDVQLHTHRHRVPLSEAPFRREIEENRRALSSWRDGEPLDGFCYPSGVTDPRLLPWLRDLGLKTGLTCEPGLAAATSDPLLLPRLVDTTGMTPSRV